MTMSAAAAAATVLETQYLVRFRNATVVLSDSRCYRSTSRTPITTQLLTERLLSQLSLRVHIPASRLQLTLPNIVTSSNDGGGSGGSRVVYGTAELRDTTIRGGKGGFGTLLKGQSKQAGAKTTYDFGACRDLNGRRLRHVNDEIKLRKWRWWQSQQKLQAAQQANNGQGGTVSESRSLEEYARVMETPS
eukprot:CAMPEP_0194372984 /NCGR_PEP_ID=MMETSP0174-20130528/21404_1 /TAXON_ID=216777 /ORGANISM="Proboscia alata, Strain PI-D3" /LENGTH=189 /DNA_ID=CAMNT_0039151809 /DNA_START=58 /DNA_END=624 /DNA_ORIENTATION=+